MRTNFRAILNVTHGSNEKNPWRFHWWSSRPASWFLDWSDHLASNPARADRGIRLMHPPLPWLSRFQGAITQYIPKMTSVPLCLSTALSSPSFLSRSWQNVPFSPGLGTWTWKSKTASVKHLHESLTWKVHMIAPPAADLRLPCDSTGPHQQKSHPMKYEREKPPGS